DAHFQETRHIRLRNDAADEDADMPKAGLLQELEDARDERHVSAGQQAEPEPVRILIADGAYHCFRRLPQPGVDDVQAGIAQGPRDGLDTAVVAIKADLGQDNANMAFTTLG